MLQLHHFVNHCMYLQAITQSMQSLPGVDINSPEVQAAIAEASRALDKRDQDDKSDTT